MVSHIASALQENFGYPLVHAQLAESWVMHATMPESAISSSLDYRSMAQEMKYFPFEDRSLYNLAWCMRKAQAPIEPVANRIRHELFFGRQQVLEERDALVVVGETLAYFALGSYHDLANTYADWIFDQWAKRVRGNDSGMVSVRDTDALVSGNQEGHGLRVVPRRFSLSEHLARAEGQDVPRM
ncbi:hypothetical protein COY28_01755 [Candidatus Woesearchaeota archaeon CG_4_10_14_0_2_um_filter_57_5]|nr:MAG: hypothetical protein COY28_01755 [Candidatus Woesearchaeota archaeon CG_4_10_14_0_2_um_filter_57_5]